MWIKEYFGLIWLKYVHENKNNELVDHSKIKKWKLSHSESRFFC